jgi:uncharacterized protein YggE
MKMRTSLAMAIGLAAIGAAAAAQAPVVVPGMPTTLTVVAEGKVARAPDIAQLSGGVVTTAATAAAAMADNSRQMNAVAMAVKKAGIADRDVQTTGLSLQPQYKYGDNQPPVLTGYQASNTVSLRIRKISDAGRIVDTLVAAGVNQINGPNFSIDDSSSALDEARTAAMKTARARASLYAAAAGMRVKRIAAISESGGEQPGPRPMLMSMRAKEADSMPIAPGEVALTINVTVTFELE